MMPFELLTSMLLHTCKVGTLKKDDAASTTIYTYSYAHNFPEMEFKKKEFFLRQKDKLPLKPVE